MHSKSQQMSTSCPAMHIYFVYAATPYSFTTAPRICTELMFVCYLRTATRIPFARGLFAAACGAGAGAALLTTGRASISSIASWHARLSAAVHCAGRAGGCAGQMYLPAGSCPAGSCAGTDTAPACPAGCAGCARTYACACACARACTRACILAILSRWPASMAAAAGSTAGCLGCCPAGCPSSTRACAGGFRSRKIASMASRGCWKAGSPSNCSPCSAGCPARCLSLSGSRCASMAKGSSSSSAGSCLPAPLRTACTAAAAAAARARCLSSMRCSAAGKSCSPGSAAQAPAGTPRPCSGWPPPTDAQPLLVKCA